MNHWTQKALTQAERTAEIALMKGTVLRDLLESAVMTIGYFGQNGHIIGLLEPQSFGRVKSEMILGGDVEVSEASLEIGGVKIYRSPIGKEEKLILLMAHQEFDIPRAVQLSDFNTNDKRACNILLDWIEHKLKKGDNPQDVLDLARYKVKLK